jgi:hypothetical protein
VYDEGCPCFNDKDVDTFLSFVAFVGADPAGYCQYIGGDFLDLYAAINNVSYEMTVTATQCSSFRTDGRSVPIDALESDECRDLIANAGAKDQMEDAGCDIS